MKKIISISIFYFALISNVICQIPNYVPSNGLVGWWPFSGNANDLSGNGYDGTVIGATQTTDRLGISNRAYNFSGTNNVINLANSQNIVSGSFSVSAWCTIENLTTTNNDATIIGQLSQPSNDRKWLFGFRAYQGNSGTSNYLFNNSGVMQTFYDQNWFPQASTWYHITWVFNAGISIDTYLNGVLHFSQTTTMLNFNNVANNVLTRIGNAEDIDSPNNLPWIGKIDDIGIWNRVLTPQEITDLYNAINCANTTISPQTNSLNSGSTATFTASTSDPNPSFVWQSDLGQGFQTLNNFGNYSGVNTATLNISNVQLSEHNQPIRVLSTSGNCIDTSNAAVINILDTCLVTVYDTLLTTVTDTLIINTTLGLPAPNNENTILIYPNPASDFITIDNGNYIAMAGYSIKIENNAGQQVFQSNINQQLFTIDLSTWSGDGLYFVHLIDAQGNTVTVRKIVLQ